MKKKIYFLLVITGMISVFVACNNTGQEKEVEKTTELDEDQLYKEANTYFAAIPMQSVTDQYEMTDEKIKLGKMLYFDKRLSKNNTISCNSCHQLDNYGVDNEKTSLGDGGERGGRNSPTTLNAAFHFSQFWDGRAKDVEEQAGMPIMNPIEHGIPSEGFLVSKLKGIKMYQDMFKEAFPDETDPLTYKNLTYAIGAFERTLLSEAPFDKYLKGQKDALTAQQKKGLKTFIETGCITCHSGNMIGGSMFNKFGVHEEYWTLTGSEPVDEGRFEVTGEESDKYMFKVPSLRNIEKTHPYFHDGSVAELSKAVKIMAQLQNDKELTDQEVEDIVAFLKSLTGDISVTQKTPPSEVAGQYEE